MGVYKNSLVTQEGVSPSTGSSYAGVSNLGVQSGGVEVALTEVFGGGVTTVVILGASISNAVAGGREQQLANMFADNGLTIQVFNESTGGRKIAGTSSHWETIKANYASLGDKLIVYVHSIGNDVSASHPYYSMTQLEIDTLKNSIDGLMNSITANGNLPILVETTFRGYDSISVSNGHTWENEDNGSDPYNEFIIHPTASLLSPSQAIGGKTRNQDYNWSYNYGNLILETANNRIHPSVEGYDLLRRLWVDNISAMIKGHNPALIAKSTSATALSIVREALPVMITVRDDGESTRVDRLLPASNKWDPTETLSSKRLAPMYGYAPTSITLSAGTGVFPSTENTGVSDDGNRAPTLDNWVVKSSTIYTDSVDYLEVCKIGGLSANQQVYLEIGAYRERTVQMISEFRINGSAATLICNAKMDSGTNIQDGIFTADASGDISIELRGVDGSYAYFSGLKVTPL
jgi:hypothetical protein